MSTFQRLFILLVFCGLGLAAAAVIVHAPSLPGGLQGLALRSTTDEPPARAAKAAPEGTPEGAPRPETGEAALQAFPAAPPIEPSLLPVDQHERPVGDQAPPTAPFPQDRDGDTDTAEIFPVPPRRLLFPGEVVPASPLPAPARPPSPFEAVTQVVDDSASDTDGDKRPIDLSEPKAKRTAQPSPAKAPVDQPAEQIARRRRSLGPVIQASNSSDVVEIGSAASQAEPIPEEGDGLLDINIPNTDIREVLQLLSEAGDLNILASKNVSGNVKATLTGVDVDTALKAILRSTGYVARREGDFVYVGTPLDFKAMDQAADRVTTRVYRPNYITAAELQTLITPMLSPTVGSISVSSPAEVGIAADQASAGGNDFAGAEVVLVRDYETVLAQIDQVFHEVDRRPLQVSIEAMILSVKLTDEFSLGVDWDLFRRNNNVRLVFGSPPASPDAIDTSSNSGLVFGYLDSNIAFFLDALESVGETHVISQPRLMCLNKQRAEIHIGEERGYVSTTVTETAATQSVEFLEVGTQLRLRPFISSDGLIRLEVHPELSTGTVEVSDNFTLPNKTVTQVTTNVMVRDGATLVIGGLLREDLQVDTEQVPLLGSLPVVGPLFRNKTDKTERDEIIVLITPRIVWEPRFNCEGEYAHCEAHQQHAIMADKMSPISRNFYGRKYRRLAKAAWVAGDAKSALRYINLSLHFNHIDRESIQLRSEIIANSPYGGHNVHTHLKEGLYPWQHPTGGGKLTNWVLDDLHGPNTHVGQEPAPGADRGVSGPQRELFVPPPSQLGQPPHDFEGDSDEGEPVEGEPVEGELIQPESE